MRVIRSAAFPADRDEVRKIFLEYQADAGIDLCFQGFAGELDALPGSYATPAGRLMLAVDETIVLGCVALRPLQGHECEMKRLYVRYPARGSGVGRLLTTSVLDEARSLGYRRVLLETLPSMGTAIELYRSLGFQEVAPSRPNPIAGALYFALELQTS
jgi:ribosomal protein S18 acetylase RimI-like enzyme